MRILVEVLLWIAGLGIFYTVLRGFPGVGRLVLSPVGVGAAAVAVVVFVLIPRARGRRRRTRGSGA